jgi:Ca2+-binding EF-hand superfamily protein
VNKNNAINYTEFLAAALETQGTIEEYRLAEAFDLLDRDGSGYSTYEPGRHVVNH